MRDKPPQATPEIGHVVNLEVLQAALNDAGEGVVLVYADELRYLYVNETAARLLHMSRKELLSFGPLNCIAWDNGVSESTFKVALALQRVIESHPLPTTEEAEVTRLDGSVFRAEFIRRAIRSDDRWIVISMFRDITQRQATHARLEIFRRALDDSDEAIYLVDPERLEFVDVNERACRLDGVSREELMRIGPVGWDFTADELRARCAAAIAAHPESVVEEVQRQQPSGKTIVIEKARRAIRSEGQWLMIVHVRDITERRTAEQELRRSNEELKQFAYVTSHDLSEPLRMMASYAQLLQRRYGDRLDQDAREFIGFINDGAKRMKLLIDALLEYSRAGRQQARQCALDRSLDDALANLAQALRDSRAVVEREPLPEVSADPIAMMQLFQNLVGNALKFRGSTAPHVRIQASDAGKQWLLTVQDNGIGIAPEHAERIFVLFQRLNSRAQYEGTGIGLSICKKIIERYGGRIWVESQPGHGATFRFTLPKKRLDTGYGTVLP
jgi:PAS domain S-box-containing protein